MTMREFGASGDASDIIVSCGCGAERRMADAFDPDSPFACTGHHPHLRLIEQGCTEPAKAILLGSSNSWFPTTFSALSIPRAVDKIGKLVEEQWSKLTIATSISKLGFYREEQQNYQSLIPLFSEFSDEEIWAAIELKRSGIQGANAPAEDLKLPEWQVFFKA